MAKFKTQFNKRPVTGGVFPCDEMLPGDGQDPRYDRDESSNKVVNRKALQLCSQVKDVLNVSFGLFTWEIAYVESVVPSPDSGNLRVNVFTTADPNEVLVSLNQAVGFLRSEVSKSISRKRTPRLTFTVRA